MRPACAALKNEAPFAAATIDVHRTCEAAFGRNKRPLVEARCIGSRRMAQKVCNEP
jgi:hypothetical protein